MNEWRGEFRGSNRELEEEFLIFTFKVGCEHAFPYILLDFFLRPEASAVQLFLAGADDAVVDRAVDIDQFTLPWSFKDVMSQGFRLEICDAQLFANLSF